MGKRAMGEYRDQRWRLMTLCVFFASFALLLLYRTYSYQVLEYQRFRDLASEEHSFKKQIVPRRGDILDRSENPLAISVMYDSVFAYLPAVKDASTTASRLAPLLGEPREGILAKLQSGSKGDVLIRRKLPEEVSTKIANLGLAGIYLQREPFRGYPEGSIAAQLLGFVGKDFNGLSGLELSLDRDLAGEPGLLLTEKDTEGSEIALAQRELIPPRDGADAILTVDRYIQRMVERELKDAIKESKGYGGVIIVMEPKTGAILGMASQPTYDLTAENVYDPAHAELYKPTVVTDMYEPGSVMKLVTMAAGLEEKKINPNTTFQDTGVAVIDGVRIRNWDFGAHGTETMTQVLINSCNIGAQYVSGLLGKDLFYQYVDAFGFGKTTGIELPGESPGRVRTPKEPEWTRIDLATNAYGQGIAVTPLQMITAVSAIANDGVLVKPRIVKGFRQGDSVREMPPVQVRRVISSETAKTLTGMMVHVVEDNSLRLSVVPGYKIAGKSGTADIPMGGAYNLNVTYASQVGFAPVDDPRFVILVRIDGPEKLYGGQVAAPIFKKISEQLFTYMKLPPTEPIKPRPAPTAGPAPATAAPVPRPTQVKATPVAGPTQVKPGPTATPTQTKPSSTAAPTQTKPAPTAEPPRAKPSPTGAPAQPKPVQAAEPAQVKPTPTVDPVAAKPTSPPGSR